MAAMKNYYRVMLGKKSIYADGSGHYRIGDVSGDYVFTPGENLPQQRPVNWLSHTIDRAEMSEAQSESKDAGKGQWHKITTQKIKEGSGNLRM